LLQSWLEWRFSTAVTSTVLSTRGASVLEDGFEGLPETTSQKIIEPNKNNVVIFGSIMIGSYKIMFAFV
jgi:hypothetical protein